MTAALPIDALGALCPDNQVHVDGAPDGPLSGLAFAVKDVFDVAGSGTGNGHPEWLRTHPPASRHAAAVSLLLDAGATLVARTISDELAYSLTGENVHYGTPLNPAAPDRVPGGSSSGSASVVAAGAVDFALGSDCGGSIRLPASYCGIWGMRPSHGRVSLDGAVPFAPSFDCAGWFARDPDMFGTVGQVLLGAPGPIAPIRRLLVAEDAFALLDPAMEGLFDGAIGRLADRVDEVATIRLSEGDLGTWSEAFRVLQAAEVWRCIGAWVEEVGPTFGPGVADRVASARDTDPDALAAAENVRAEVRLRLDGLLAEGTAIVLPSAPRPAPKRGLPVADVEVAQRHRAMNLLCSAGLAGLPQISMPLVRHEGLPVGLSLLGRRGHDIDLLDLAQAIGSTHLEATGK